MILISFTSYLRRQNFDSNGFTSHYVHYLLTTHEWYTTYNLIYKK